MHIVEAAHSFVDEMPYQAGTSAQRIRIGLTGLAIAFLVVLLASAISRASRDDVSNAAANAAQEAAVNEPSEPLAEIGVAPGATDTANATTNNAVARK